MAEVNKTDPTLINKYAIKAFYSGKREGVWRYMSGTSQQVDLVCAAIDDEERRALTEAEIEESDDGHETG